MTKLLLDNVYLNSDLSCPTHFNISIYKFYPEIIASMNKNNYRKHQQNASVKFEGRQLDSILFSGGIVGAATTGRRRKLIEDILIIGSVLTGWNWGLTSRRNASCYPLRPNSHLSCLDIDGAAAMEKHLNAALNKILDASWQKKYDNGFHLRMLINSGNIHHVESRFLNNVVLWEWLYPHEKNPNGATAVDECSDLKKIINFVLETFWPGEYKMADENNIFHALRNQLAHSGKLPIDRPKNYVDPWMRELEWDSDGINLQGYLDFFNSLTRVIVLKTIGIDTQCLVNNHMLNSFLTTGRLPHNQMLPKG